MNEKADKFERLLSERPDRAASAEDLATVDRALADNPQAAETARQYDKLQALLKDWRSLPPGIDWDAVGQRLGEHAVSKGAECDTATASKDKTLDALVHGQAAPLPDVDWDRLKSRISFAVHEEAARNRQTSIGTRRGWLNRLGKMGAPVAAAAAIAFAVWWPGDVKTPPVAGLTQGPAIVVAVETPAKQGNVLVRFVETPLEQGIDTSDGPGGYAYAHGPARGEFAESIETGMFY